MTIMDGGRRRFSGDGIPGHPITAAVTAAHFRRRFP